MGAAYLNPSLIANSGSGIAQDQQQNNPLNLAQGVARVQQLGLQAQQGQANLQQTQLGNQQMAQEIKDQQAFGQAVAESGGDPDKLEAATASLTSPRIQLMAQDTISKLRARAAATTAEQDKVTAARNQQLLSQLQGVREATDPATKAALWQQTASAALAAKDPSGQPLLTTQHIDPNTVPDDGTLQAYETYLDRSGQFMTGLAKRKSDLATAAKAQTEADNQAFESAVQSVPSDPNDPDIQSKWTTWRNSLPQSKQSGVPVKYSPSAVANIKLATVPTAQQPEYLIKARQASAAQAMTPQSIEKDLGSVIDPGQHPADFKEALSRAMLNYNGGSLTQPLLDAIAKEYTDKYASARERRSEATDPAIIAADVGKAVATQRALRQGSNPDLANVAPEAVTGVQNQAIKLDQDYAKAKSATDTLGRVLDLADQGNAAAGTNVAAMGTAGINAVNGIKRINPSSVEGYGNAGSLLDDIQGKLKKWDGKGPLDQNVLDEIRELHQTVGQQAYQTYTDSLNSVNQRSGATLKPTLPPPNISKAAKTYKQADVDAVVRNHPGSTAQQVENAFKAKGYVKTQ